MNNEETCLEVNDYLDLYLLAGNLGDKLWQQEMIVKLQNREQSFVHNQNAVTLENLWREYKKINQSIHELYLQLQTQPLDEHVQEELWNLKKQRLDLGRKIFIKERKA